MVQHLHPPGLRGLPHLPAVHAHRRLRRPGRGRRGGGGAPDAHLRVRPALRHHLLRRGILGVARRLHRRPGRRVEDLQGFHWHHPPPHRRQRVRTRGGRQDGHSEQGRHHHRHRGRLLDADRPLRGALLRAHRLGHRRAHGPELRLPLHHRDGLRRPDRLLHHHRRRVKLARGLHADGGLHDCRNPLLVLPRRAGQENLLRAAAVDLRARSALPFQHQLFRLCQ
mmetsp:Transcript_27940/g.83297  ORF Transcript_27940/g.83297 Transcript_27940/m.83297 type:complete len:224 (-) Transcript_27940:1-672(-)